MINGPKFWNSLLDKCPAGSILMGGAVRDFIVGVEPKDFDIFYPYRPMYPAIEGWEYKEYNQAEAAKRREDYGLDEDGANVNAERNPLAIVRNYEIPVADDADPIKVQLMGVHFNDARHMYRLFDHTLTLGRYSRKGLFVDARLFESLDTKTVTCTNGHRGENSLNRAKRVVARIDPQGVNDWNFLGF